jgi:hypothetical protein
MEKKELDEIISSEFMYAKELSMEIMSTCRKERPNPS